MSHIRSRMAAIVSVAALGITGLPAGAAQATSAGAPKAVDVFVTRTHLVRMNSQLRPGLRRFVIHSAGNAAFQLVRPRRGYTKGEFVRDANAGLNHNNIAALRRFERNVTLIGGTGSRKGKPGVLWAGLRAGRYWAVDTNARTTTVRELRTVHVAGRPVHGQGARPNAVIRAIHEADWAPRPAVIPRSGVMSFRNDSADNHFIAMGKIKRGKTFADVRAFIRRIKNGQRPGEDPLNEKVGLGSGAVSPGHRMSMRYDLPAGRYVLICFWPDADMHGTPHGFLGMYRKIVLR